MKVIFIFFLIGILFLITTPVSYAESFLSTVNEKYTIEKKVGWGWWPDLTIPTEITVVDSRNNTSHANGTKNFDILVSDLVATSKGGVSSADNTLSGDLIIITSEIPDVIVEKSDGSKTLNLSGNLTKFEINVDTVEEDTVTYSGKIFLKNESVLIPIPVEVMIHHDVGELIVSNITGIIIGVVAAGLLIRYYCGFAKKLWFTTQAQRDNCRGFKWSADKPWISSMVIVAVGIPSSVLVNTTLIGSNSVDVIIAFGVGLLVLTKILARGDKKDEDEPKDKISLEFNPKEIDGDKRKLLDNILLMIAKFRGIIS